MDGHRSTEEIEAAMRELGEPPRDRGTLKLIVCRPRVDERQVLQQAELDCADGLVGDRWGSRGGANPDAQLTIMNSRLIQALEPDPSGWPMAGDQLFLDLDLSEENLPTGQRLAIGTAVVEITAKPHTGCGKFAERYGPDAVRLVNSPEGLRRRLRGLNARVVQSGTISVGDIAIKMREIVDSSPS